MSDDIRVECARAEDFIDTLPDACVSLITIDPPYYGVKDEHWDNAWPTPEAFIAWLGGVLEKCRRVLRPNGSIYVFAAPQVRGGLTMATRVECEVARWFAVLGRITWKKEEGRQAAAEKEALRQWWPASEVIIFAEQPGSDSIALGESQYGAKCDELRGFIFEPLRAYLDGERERAGLTRDVIDGAWQKERGNKGGMSSHWFSRSQWALPTAKNYAWIRSLAPDFFKRSHEELRAQYEELRAQYEELRAQYEELRRPFSVTAEVPYTDVWTYPTVNAYPGKHLCEKPERMARDMVRASSRPGDLVADFFCGSGAFIAAAIAEGRRAVGCDMDPHWANEARRRCENAQKTGRILRSAPAKVNKFQIDLFDNLDGYK